jgi:DNA-binding transcriptional MerR regulator
MWEQRYDFIKPKRTGTNIRFYDDNDLKLVLNISLLKDNGHKISRICKMCTEDMQKEVVKLTEDRLTLPEQIHALTLAMVDCDEARFDKILNANFQLYGLEETIINLIFPFFNKIGIMWQTGSVYPSHEHFISNLVRQKLISAINNLSCPEEAFRKKYLLFLPENEFHELSLLFSYYLLKTRNNKVIYLGQNLQLPDIRTIYHSVEPDYILTVLTASPQPNQVQSYIDIIAKEFDKSKVLISGRQVFGHNIHFPENVLLLHKYQDLIDICESN